MKQSKSEEIKARIEPITKHTLEQLANREHLDLSDIVRRALREFIERNTPGMANHGRA